MHIDTGETTLEHLLPLYESVGWAAYTRDPQALARAVAHSTWVARAWDGSRLIGLARALSDEVAIAYLQDVLVHPEYQRHGVGRALVVACAERFAHVRMHVLMTDDEPRQL